jgi:ZIP family zinc transporter
MDPIIWVTTVIQNVSDSVIVQSFLTACIGFILTVIGSLPALLGVRVGSSIIPYGMGFASGVMITASFTSLLLPAVEVGGIVPIPVGFLIGALLIYVVDRFLPHEHLVKGYEGLEKLRMKLRTAWLMAMAIVIHNIPEGAAVGAAVVESLKDGVILAVAIGIQNIPEGLAVALPLVSLGRNVRLALLVALLSGVVEPIAAVTAATLAIISREILPYLLSFAAGAMIYVVSHEIIPETHSEKREVKATVALLVGFILMFMLDIYYD